jgi:hypothetical protein
VDTVEEMGAAGKGAKAVVREEVAMEAVVREEVA